MSMGMRLKEVRKRTGFTQEQFAEQFGLKWHSIKAIEIGQQKISVELAEQIETFYSISGWWLLTGRGSMLTTDVNTPQEFNDSVIGIGFDASSGGNKVKIINGTDKKNEINQKTMDIFSTVYRNAVEAGKIKELNIELWALGAKFE